MSDAPRLSEVRGSGSSSGAGVLGVVLVTSGALCGIGVTAAIAIPNFEAVQQKARRSEVPANVDSIRTAELAYFAQFGRYLPAGSPEAAAAELAGDAGKRQRPWGGAGTGTASAGDRTTTPAAPTGWRPRTRASGWWASATWTVTEHKHATRRTQQTSPP